MNLNVKHISLLGFTTLLCACSPVKVKPIQKYTITNYQGSVATGGSQTRKTILVTTPIADPGYQTDKMIYVKTPYDLQSFSYHKWTAPPAQMVLPILMQALNKTHYFYAVVGSPFSGNSTYRLDTKLLSLQQEFLLPQSRVRLVMQASILNNQTNQIAASRTFKVVLNAQTRTPYSGVIATTQAVNRIAKQIADFAIRSVNRRRYTSSDTLELMPLHKLSTKKTKKVS